MSDEEDISIAQLQAAPAVHSRTRSRQSVEGDDDEGQLSDDGLRTSHVASQAITQSTISKSSRRQPESALSNVSGQQRSQTVMERGGSASTQRGRTGGSTGAHRESASEDGSAASSEDEDDGFVRRNGRSSGAPRGTGSRPKRAPASRSASSKKPADGGRKRSRPAASSSRPSKRTRTRGYDEDDFVVPEDQDSSDEEGGSDDEEEEYEDDNDDRRKKPARKARTPGGSSRKPASSRRVSSGSGGSKAQGKGRYMEGKADWSERRRGRRDEFDSDEEEESDEEDEENTDINVYFQVDRLREEAEESQRNEAGLGIGKAHERAATKVSPHEALDIYLQFLVASLVCPEDVRTYCYSKSSTPDAKVWKEVSRTIEQPISAATRTLGESVAWLDSTGELGRTRLPFVKTAVMTLPYFQWTELSSYRKKSRSRSGREEEEGDDEDEYGDTLDASDHDEDGWSDDGRGGGESTALCGDAHQREACQACRRIGHPQQVKLTLSGPLVDSDGLGKENESWLDAIPRGEFRHHEYVVQVGHQCATRMCLAMALQHWKYKILLALSRLVSQAMSDGTIEAASASSSAAHVPLEPTKAHVARVRMEVAHLLEYSGSLRDKGEGSERQPVLDDEETEGGKQEAFVEDAIQDAVQYCGGLDKFDRSRPLPGYAGLKEKARRQWIEDHEGDLEPWEADPHSHFLQETRSIRALTWAGAPARRSFLRHRAAFLLFMHSDEHGPAPASLLPIGSIPRAKAGPAKPFTSAQAQNAQELASTFADEILRPLREDQQTLALKTLDVGLPLPTTEDFNLLARLPVAPAWDNVKALFKTPAWKEFVHSQEYVRKQLLNYVDVYASNATKKERDEAWEHADVLQHGEDHIGARDRGNATMLHFAVPEDETSDGGDDEEEEEAEEGDESDDDVEELSDDSSGSFSEEGLGSGRPRARGAAAHSGQTSRATGSRNVPNFSRPSTSRTGPIFDEEESEEEHGATAATTATYGSSKQVDRTAAHAALAGTSAGMAVKQGNGIQIDSDDE